MPLRQADRVAQLLRQLQRLEFRRAGPISALAESCSARPARLRMLLLGGRGRVEGVRLVTRLRVG